MVGVFGLLTALGGLMFFAYRGVNVLFLAPIMALVACLFHPGTPLLASYTQIFMPALGNYLLQYFPIFLLGSIFGKVMNESGAAFTIARAIANSLGAKHAILAVVLACALLTYGGVSLFVVAFTIYPIALTLFREAQIPRRLIPGTIALGSFTFTMTALPGTPAIQNAIPMPIFGTTAFAAPILGFVAAMVMLGFGMFWLLRRAAAAARAGEGFTEGAAEADTWQTPESAPGLLMALTPLLVVVALNYYFSNYLFPQLDLNYLGEEKYGKVNPQKVVGLWSLVTSLTISLLVAFALFWRKFKDRAAVINEGTFGSMLPIFNTASEVGFGATIASLASFGMIKNGLLGILPEYPLVSLSIVVNALAGITGSASGGLSIALQAFGQTFVDAAKSGGVDLATMHRVATVACSGLDALPHNGAVITLLAICGLTHRQSYLDILMTAVVGTVTANAVIVVIASFL